MATARHLDARYRLIQSWREGTVSNCVTLKCYFHNPKESIQSQLKNPI